MQSRIDLDRMEEPVKRFLGGLAVSVEPSVAEFDGRKVFIMVRPSTGEAKPWSGETDRRRCELIDKQIDGAASIEEAVELSELQTAFDRWIDSVAPLPLEPVRRLHDQLLSRVLADSLSDPRPE